MPYLSFKNTQDGSDIIFTKMRIPSVGTKIHIEKPPDTLGFYMVREVVATIEVGGQGIGSDDSEPDYTVWVEPVPIQCESKSFAPSRSREHVPALKATRRMGAAKSVMFVGPGDRVITARMVDRVPPVGAKIMPATGEWYLVDSVSEYVSPRGETIYRVDGSPIVVTGWDVIRGEAFEMEDWDGVDRGWDAVSRRKM